MSISAFVVGVVIFATLLLSLFVSYKQSRDDTAIENAIEEIRREGAKLDSQLQEEYEVTVDEAVTRLGELRAGLVGAITFLSTRIPGDFERKPHRE